MSNELMPLDLSQLPSTSLGSDDQFKELAKGGDFLARLQLFTKSKANQKGLIAPGHYGVQETEDRVEDLGTEVDILPLARRPKAIDLSDTEAIVTSYDMQSEEFKRIETAAGQSDSHCQFGPSFLVYERTLGRFLEWFCGNKSARVEAKNLFPYLPVTQAEAEQRGVEPHGPIPATLQVKFVETKKYSWHVPVITRCTLPFTDLPPTEQIVAAIQRFLTEKGNGVEKVEAAPTRAR